ncbi:PKD domain-containing protein [Tunicatimonas pelagia]|uniref:PKD domain-containing protein n=1 Tax=Tunicatimonas pelagia TaxID=931531 RepID=UPI002666C2A5|nr:PKD domain-containing protein [Tunicatimonas pelagia]WKN43607.1 PKD domain-containing protein [Tunicatimonas pelagia]
MCTLILESSVLAIFNSVSAQFQITLGSTEIRENSIPKGLGNVGVGDFEDEQGNLIDYELVEGEGSEGNNFFFIAKKDNNSQLQATPRQGFDYEEQVEYSIRVRASLAGTTLDERTFTIKILDVEEPPTDILLSNNLVDPDAEEDDVVGEFSVVDGAPVEISYNLLDDADEAFTLDGNKLVVGDEFDDEDQASYTIEVQAVGNGTFEKFFTITVDNSGNQPPTANAGSDTTVTVADENSRASVPLNGLSSSDPEMQPLTYLWTWTEGGVAQSVTGATPIITLPVGIFTINLEVTDDQLTQGLDAVTITVNALPTAVAVATPPSGPAPLTVNFDASQSSDGVEGEIVTYAWDFGDGSVGNGQVVTHMYSTDSIYTAMLIVTDNLGAADSSEITITVSATPELTLSTDSILVDEDFTETQSVTATLVNATQEVNYSVEPTDLGFATLTASLTDGSYFLSLSAQPHLNGNADLTVTATSANQTYQQTVNVAVAAVNDAPMFTLANNLVTVAANSERQTVPNFATNIAPGPAEATDESGQVLSFDLGDYNQTLFLEEPSISPDGTLAYQVAENQAGSTNVSVTLKDNGAFDGANVNFTDPQSFTLNVEAPLNQPPTANAGADQTFTDTDGSGNETVTLDGSASSDPEAQPLAYTWSWPGGVGATGVNPTITLPVGTTTVTLTVTDVANVTATDEVVITVNEQPNQPPVANAGIDKVVEDSNRSGDEIVTLDGSDSSDPENLPLTYTWSWLADGANQSANGVSPTISLPVGITTIVLTVSDSEGATATDEVIVTVNAPANQLPVANAGADQTLLDNDRSNDESVTLDGSASSDDVGITTYTWSWANSESASGVNPTIILPIGTTTITLTVTDAAGATATDEVVIVINEPANQPPLASAGQDQTLEDSDGSGDETVVLDGSGSSDPEGQALTYAWSWPGGNNAIGETPTITLPVGETVITLTVTDNQGVTATDEVVIIVVEVVADITLSDSLIQENQADALVGTLGVVGGEEPVVFSLVGTGNDNDEFTIDGNQLKTKDSLDFEAGATRLVTVRATANNDGGLDKTFTITVENQEEAPTDITLDDFDVNENQVSALVGNLGVVGGQAPFTFSLTGIGSDLFTIDGVQLKTNGSLNFEETPSPKVEVTVNSADGSFAKEFTVVVNNLEEPPTNILLSSNSVNENVRSNTPVGTFSAEGGSVANPTFQLIRDRDDNGLFRLVGSQLRTNAVFNREERDSYTIQVQALGEGSITQSLTINITDVNDAPKITVTDDQVLFAEGSDPVKVLPDITVEDEDNPELSGATLSFVNNYVPEEDELLTSADHQWNNQAGRLIINGPLSIAALQEILRNVTYRNRKTINPTSSARQIRVVVNDGALDSNAEQIFVLVDNPNVPPVLTDFSVEVAEDDSRTLVATDFETNHEDADDDFPNQIYLVSGPLEGVLTVDGQVITSEVILASISQGLPGFLVDFATVASITYSPTEGFNGSDEFRWDVPGGANAATVNIEVLSVNDAPILLTPNQLLVQENTALALSDITLSDTDNDVLLLTLSVTNGTLVPSASVENEVSVLESGENGGKRIQVESTPDDLARILPEIAYLPASEISDEDSLVIALTDSPSNLSGSFTVNGTINIRVGVNQPPQVSNISLEINSGQSFPFTESIFLEAYTDVDDFPGEGGFTTIRITALPESGQLVFNNEVITEEQVVGEGLLITRADIPQLSYQISSNEVASDQFVWNATDGSKFAQEAATVSFTIKLLSVTLSTEAEEVCLGESVTLTAVADGGTAPFTYQWNCDQTNCGLGDATESAVVNPVETANYQVTITDANGIQASATVPVNVVDCSLVIPTGFTPNGDNINDTWELQNINTFEEKLVEVYDRHGHQVFFSDTYNAAWDGTYNGEKLPSGTYYYRIELEAGSQSHQGKVTILQ